MRSIHKKFLVKVVSPVGSTWILMVLSANITQLLVPFAILSAIVSLFTVVNYMIVDLDDDADFFGGTPVHPYIEVIKAWADLHISQPLQKLFNWMNKDS